jgi:CubicO group peptidase (beta-lactamase class C family)
VLVAVEEGTVGLDDPAGPEGSTVRHLLAHASGLPPEAGGPASRVGARRIYSNLGYEVLAAHAEERSGMAFDAYLREAVIEPLGLSSFTLTGSPGWGGACSLDDLLRFGRELLGPTIVSAATLAEATTVAFAGLAGVLPGFGRQDPNDWGLGFELRDRKSPHWTGSRNSETTFGHFGRSGTFLWVDPGIRLACGVLTDTSFGPWAVEAWPRLSDAVATRYGKDPVS